MEEEYFTEMV